MSGPQVPQHLAADYHRFVADRWDGRLDECHGECVLKRPELARAAADSLLHFDDDRYSMGDFVVMPNHVHLLVCFPGERQLLTQCRSWKKYTATKINAALGRGGEFWQDESFDHLVRSEEEFRYYGDYIAGNPTRAGLPEGSYFLRRLTETRGPVTP